MNAQVEQLFDPSIKTRSINCPLHGLQQERGVLSNTWFGCPVCNEIEAKREAEQRAAKEANDRMDSIRLPVLFKYAGFSNYTTEADRQIKVVERIKQYMHELKTKQHTKSLILSGETGTGKTHLGAAILRNFAGSEKKPTRCRYITSADFIAELKQTWIKNSNKFESDVIAQYGQIPILMIDEMGVSDRLKTSDHWSALFDMRYRNHLPTIITTNLSQSELADLIGDRAADRLLPLSLWANCNWPSYRRIVSSMEEI